MTAPWPRIGAVEPVAPGGRPATWAATGRSGGVSAAPFDSLNLAGYVGDDPDAVLANQQRVRDLVGASGLAVLSASHGAEVVVVAEPGVAPTADAVLSQTPGLGVLALGADCVTLAIAGADDCTVAAVHCGWRGLVADVLGATLRRLADLGVEPAHVVIGPAICGACYPVPPERAAEIQASCSPQVAAAAVVRCTDGQPGIDVRAGLLVRLAECGVAPAQVHVLGECTAEDAGLFSYRRSSRTGRQGLVIVRQR